MTASKGYYRLIQYCPDLSRLEAANIGVLFFCPERQFLKGRTDKGESRIRKFFCIKRQERDQITAFRFAIEQRLEIDKENFQTLEDLTEFAAKRANAIQITNPRPMKVYDPERDPERLFEQLVESPLKKTQGGHTQHKAAPAKRLLSKAFAEGKVEHFIRKDVTVEVPAFQRKLKVPFGYQNGSFNLIQPVRFERLGEEGALKEASLYAVEGQSVANHPDLQLGELQLTIVGQFAPEQRDTEAVVGNLFDKYQVKFYTFDELNKLIDEIRTTGKVLAR